MLQILVVYGQSENFRWDGWKSIRLIQHLFQNHATFSPRKGQCQQSLVRDNLDALDTFSMHFRQFLHLKVRVAGVARRSCRGRLRKLGLAKVWGTVSVFSGESLKFRVHVRIYVICQNTCHNTCQDMYPTRCQHVCQRKCQRLCFPDTCHTLSYLISSPRSLEESDSFPLVKRDLAGMVVSSARKAQAIERASAKEAEVEGVKRTAAQLEIWNCRVQSQWEPPGELEIMRSNWSVYDRLQRAPFKWQQG